MTRAAVAGRGCSRRIRRRREDALRLRRRLFARRPERPPSSPVPPERNSPPQGRRPNRGMCFRDTGPCGKDTGREGEALTKAAIGIIGGSGIYEVEGMEVIDRVLPRTPFGLPSDDLVVGRIEGSEPVAFLPRHGRGHFILPSELNSRANIYAMKMLGVERIISLSAAGSMREEIEPLHFVLVDQFIDRTRARTSTFFGDGVVAHISFADPTCPHLSRQIYEAGRNLGITMHLGGTYVCIEGPQFSTRAESRTYRQWGVDVIGMTAIPEARLAREAEMCYATVAMVTDYDVWHESGDVTQEMVIENMKHNIVNAKKLVRELVPKLGRERKCDCGRALAGGLATAGDRITPEIKERLELIIGKYV